MGVVGTAWALDAVTGAPSYTGRVIRQTNSPTLAGATSARPFGAISGVRPGTSTTTITSTSTTWTAQTFAGVIDLEASALSGAYGFAFNLVTSGSVTASNASNPRIDILSVRIDDPAEGDGSTVPAVTMVYTAGTAAGSPVAPAAPARSFAVAQLTFPAGSGTTPTVTWVAPYTVAAGGIQPVPASTYPATPYLGQYVDDAALGLLRYNGTSFVSAVGDGVIPTATATGAGSSSSVAADGTVTFSTATAIAVDVSAFSGLEYEFTLDVTATSASVTPTVRLRAPADISTTVYDAQSVYGAAAATAASSPTGTAQWQLGLAGVIHYAKLSFTGLGQSRSKVGFSEWYSTQNPQTSSAFYQAGIQYRTASPVTGLSFLFAGGNATGTITIRKKR